LTEDKLAISTKVGKNGWNWQCDAQPRRVDSFINKKHHTCQHFHYVYHCSSEADCNTMLSGYPPRNDWLSTCCFV